jgi:hypothetical protein
MNRFDLLGTLRRFLTFAAIAFWLGGFTFYASVAVPVGMKILGSHLRQGFITQEVSQWLNVSAIPALAIMTWNMLAEWRRAGRLIRLALLTSIIAMIAIQAELFILHPCLDRLLDVHARKIIDDDRFDFLHRAYLMSATAQWGFGLLYVLCISALPGRWIGSVGDCVEPGHAHRPDSPDDAKFFGRPIH